MLKHEAAPVWLVLYLTLLVTGFWMVYFGRITQTPNDTLHGLVLIIAASVTTLPITVITGLRRR